MPHSRLTCKLLLALALWLSVSACKRAEEVEAAQGAAPPAGQADAKNKPRLVQVVELKPQAIEDKLPCTSHVQSYHGVTIVPRVVGQVVEVLAKDGQEVEKGEPLFKLDDREARLAVAAATNREAEAKQREKEAELALQESGERLTWAEKDYAQALRDLERTKKSAEQELASSKALEDAQLNHDRAKNALDLARTAQRRAQLTRERSATEVESAAIQRRIQERLLEDFTIVAPIGGVVFGFTIKGGEWVRPTTAGISGVGSDRVLAAVMDPDRLELRLSRPQKELSLLKVGQRVEIEVDAWPGETFVGRVDQIAPNVSVQTGTFEAVVRLDNPGRKLRDGMFCRAWIVTGQSHEALMIPKEAIVYEADKPFAYVVRDGKATRIAIERGIELRDELEARNRAESPRPDAFVIGDLIVTVGKDSLDRAGANVEIVRG